MKGEPVSQAVRDVQLAMARMLMAQRPIRPNDETFDQDDESDDVEDPDEDDEDDQEEEDEEADE